jgi:hypothetical protein
LETSCVTNACTCWSSPTPESMSPCLGGEPRGGPASAATLTAFWQKDRTHAAPRLGLHALQPQFKHQRAVSSCPATKTQSKMQLQQNVTSGLYAQGSSQNATE